jgi:hypothetical protein
VSESCFDIYDHDYPRTGGPELHYFKCQRVCAAVTVTITFTRRYERCRACGSMALYLYTVPVETDEQKAIHAQGVVLNPHKLPPVPWVCQRCGADKTGNTPIYRADGKVCKACYDAEMAPEDERMAAGIQAFIAAQKAKRDAEDAERREKYKHLFREEQSINQTVKQERS